MQLEAPGCRLLEAEKRNDRGRSSWVGAQAPSRSKLCGTSYWASGMMSAGLTKPLSGPKSSAAPARSEAGDQLRFNARRWVHLTGTVFNAECRISGTGDESAPGASQTFMPIAASGSQLMLSLSAFGKPIKHSGQSLQTRRRSRPRRYRAEG